MKHIKDLEAVLTAKRAKLDAMVRNHEIQQYENASRDLALSVRHELAKHVVFCPCAVGSPSEHLCITNDLPHQQIKFQINPESPVREITLDWSRNFLLSIYSNGQLMTCLQTTFEGVRLIPKNRTVEEFVNCCMVDLGYMNFKEAA